MKSIKKGFYILVALGLTNSLFATEILEREIIKEYEAPFRNVSNIDSRDVSLIDRSKNFKKTKEYGRINILANSSDIKEVDSFILVAKKGKTDPIKTHNDLIELIKENSKKLKGIDEKKLNFLLNLLVFKKAENE